MELKGDNGLFMKIVRREVPAEIVYEDELTLAFLDRTPVNPGHVLVIPKKPFSDLYEITDEYRDAVFKTVQKMAVAVKQGVNADGINIRINMEAAAGQDVFHLHVHVIPRFTGDGFEPWHGREYAEGEMAKVAENVRKAL